MKVVQFAYKKANELGILKEFLFYYDLKSINIQGFLPRGQVISQIKSKTNLSEATINRRISALHKLGWIIISKSGISLRKYDIVWKTLKITKLQYDGQRIFKIDSRGKFQSLIELEEIKSCLTGQAFQIKRKVSEDTEKSQDKLVKKFGFPKMFKLILKQVFDKDAFLNINFDVNVSCQKVALLLGYSSAMQGHLIEKKLAQEGLIVVKNRYRFINSSGNIKNIPKGCFVSKNFKIIQQLPNDIIIL